MSSVKEAAEKISLFFAEKEHKLGEIIVDAFLSETHELRAEATEHVVEDGTNFVDHIYNLPVTIQLEGIISNTPMTWLGLTAFKSAKNFINRESNDLVEAAFRKLERIFAERKPISIATSLKTYPDMVLESLSVERGGGNQETLRFRCSAKQIRMVKQRLVDVPKPKEERVKTKKNLGNQPAKPVPKADLSKVEQVKKEQSLLYSFFGG
jgi:hypothetical protein